MSISIYLTEWNVLGDYLVDIMSIQFQAMKKEEAPLQSTVDLLCSYH